jgi:RNA polymerase-binding transcription factor DksA
MNRQDKEMYWKLLLTLRAQLRGEVNLLLDTALDVDISAPPSKSRDTCRTCRATWRTSVARTLRDFIERLIDRKEAMLYRVENALARLAEGSYGFCQECESPIPDEWLLTVPYTTFCATCHSQQAVA